MVYDHFRLFIGVFSLVQRDNVVLQCREFCKTVVLQREYKKSNLFSRCYHAKRKDKIMAIETRLQIRVEEEYLDMLDEILDKEETEHLMGDGIIPTRTQIVKKAIKEYYLKTIDKKARNALSDQVETVMESQLKHFIDELNAAVSSKLLTLQYHLDEQLIREYLMLMILMKSSGLENNYDKVDENLRNDFNLAELFNDRAAEILEEEK